MISMPRMLLTGAFLWTLALAMPARAQIGDSDSNIKLDAPGLLLKKPKPGLPDVKAQPLAWPRLDPGAVLCRSEADLARLAARRSGEAVDGPVDCQIIRAATAISIVQRKGPGRAEVRTSDPRADGVTGWTDAWLPEKAPSGVTSAKR
jgi:hypothetical protein